MGGPLKVIISGAPASGKGTQCEFIKKQFNLVHLSTGDILRAQVTAGTALGKEAETYMTAGKLVPDELIIKTVLARLQEPDCQKQGWLLDGFPRTAAQALALREAGILPDIFLSLDVHEDALVERVVGRRSDPETGKIYHMTFSPPPKNDAALLTRLIQRADDNEVAVKLRVGFYQTNLGAILDFYADRTVAIDGNRAPSAIWEDIRAHLTALASRAQLAASHYEVVFLLGGPGSGKGTLATAIVDSNAEFAHLSAGDLLREEQDDPNSPHGAMIREIIVAGSIVDPKITVSLLAKAIAKASAKGKRRFLIDGFPRNLDNLTAWHADPIAKTSRVSLVLDLAVDDDALTARVLERSKFSGRADDNAHTLAKRLQTFHSTSRPVLEHFDLVGKLRRIDASLPPLAVYRQALGFLRGAEVLPTYERTFAFIKPDAVERGAVAAIQRAITEEAKLVILQARRVRLNDAAVAQFYAEHTGKSFFPELRDFMSSGPAVALLLEGTDAIRRWRELMGPTNTFTARETKPESLRARFGSDGTRNATHGSDSELSAAREIAFWFSPSGAGRACVLAGPDAADDVLSNTGSSLSGLPLTDTFAMIKPTTASVFADEIKAGVLAHGFEIVSELRTRLSLPQVERFYREHEGKDFFGRLTSYMASSPVVALHLRRVGAVAGWRHLIGPTNFERAQRDRPDSLRALFAIDGTRNAVHGSDAAASASREIAFFFSIGTSDAFLPSSALAAPTAISSRAAGGGGLSPVKSPKKKGKGKAAGSISMAELAEMQAYAQAEITPVLSSLTKKMVLERPSDVTEYLLSELTAQKAAKAAINTSTTST